MRALRALRGLSGLQATLDALGSNIGASARCLATSSGLKEALAEKIPKEQVRRLVYSGLTSNLLDWAVLAALRSRGCITPIHCAATASLLLQERLKALRKEHGSKELGKVTADMVIGGMRGITVRHALAKQHMRATGRTGVVHSSTDRHP